VQIKKEAREMKAIVAVVVFVSALVVSAQEVEIQSFGNNGELTWLAPSGSVCTIEWTSSLVPTANWQRSWIRQLDRPCSESVTTSTVPMFYRITAWTNGLFVSLPAARTYVYSVSNALGQLWTQELTCAGVLSLSSSREHYALVTITNIYSGAGRPDGSDAWRAFLIGEGLCRSTESAFFARRGDDRDASYGVADHTIWQAAPYGTTWTNPPDEDGDVAVRTLVTNETVAVPAGTFEGCLKYSTLYPDDVGHPRPEIIHWVKPGFHCVKTVDYWEETNATPVVFQLQSWRDE